MSGSFPKSSASVPRILNPFWIRTPRRPHGDMAAYWRSARPPHRNAPSVLQLKQRASERALVDVPNFLCIGTVMGAVEERVPPLCVGSRRTQLSMQCVKRKQRIKHVGHSQVGAGRNGARTRKELER